MKSPIRTTDRKGEATESLVRTTDRKEGDGKFEQNDGWRWRSDG